MSATDARAGSASRLELAAAVLGLVAMTGCLSRVGGGASSVDNPGTVSTAAQTLVTVIALFRLLDPRARVRHRLGFDPWLLVLLVVAVVSLTQSVDSSLGARRITAAISYTIFGLYLADRFVMRQQLVIVTCAVGACAAATIVLGIGWPSVAHMSPTDNAWRGVFVQKNVLARTSVLGCAAAVHLLCVPMRTGHRVAVSAVVAVTATTIVTAQSVLAPVALTLALLPLVLRPATRAGDPLRGGLLAGAAAIATTTVVLITTSGGLLAVLGKDPSLNGRAPLWASVVDAISQHPWLGYGYGTFWRGWLAPSTMVTLENTWGPPHAHNGLLDLALGIGIIGAAVWVVVVLRGIVAAVRVAATSADAAVMWPLAFLVLLVVYNIFEVTTTSNALFWSLFIGATTSARAASAAVPVGVVFRPLAASR